MTLRLSDVSSEHLLRELAPQVLGAVIRRFRDFATAEDAVQEALLAASMQWPREGFPDNPRGWLIRVASRRMIDHLRSDLARRRLEDAAATQIDYLVAPAVDIENETEIFAFRKKKVFDINCVFVLALILNISETQVASDL